MISIPSSTSSMMPSLRYTSVNHLVTFFGVGGLHFRLECMFFKFSTDLFIRASWACKEILNSSIVRDVRSFDSSMVAMTWLKRGIKLLNTLATTLCSATRTPCLPLVDNHNHPWDEILQRLIFMCLSAWSFTVITFDDPWYLVFKVIHCCLDVAAKAILENIVSFIACWTKYNALESFFLFSMSWASSSGSS